jgi:hypothetical protein
MATIGSSRIATASNIQNVGLETAPTVLDSARFAMGVSGQALPTSGTDVSLPYNLPFNLGLSEPSLHGGAGMPPTLHRSVLDSAMLAYLNRQAFSMSSTQASLPYNLFHVGLPGPSLYGGIGMPQSSSSSSSLHTPAVAPGCHGLRLHLLLHCPVQVWIQSCCCFVIRNCNNRIACWGKTTAAVPSHCGIPTPPPPFCKQAPPPPREMHLLLCHCSPLRHHHAMIQPPPSPPSSQCHPLLETTTTLTMETTMEPSCSPPPPPPPPPHTTA